MRVQLYIGRAWGHRRWATMQVDGLPCFAHGVDKTKLSMDVPWPDGSGVVSLDKLRDDQWCEADLTGDQELSAAILAMLERAKEGQA